ncbi:MAG: alpha/beta fold hydrolase [Bacteroidota bacterium]
MKHKKWRWIVLIFLLVLTAAIYFGVNIAAPYGIIIPLRVDPANHGEKYWHPSHPSFYNLNYDTLDIVTDDSIHLAGYWVKPRQSDSLKGSFIFLHGISSCKEVFLEFASFLADQGVGSVLFDLRAHGKSGGQFNTYGYHEKRDVAVVNQFIKKQEPNLAVGVWGNSLGGAIAYQSLAYDTTLDFGVIQSTFARLPQIVDDYGKRIIGFRIPGLANYALEKASRIADFPGFEVVPANSCKEITQPVYVMHGDQDINIDISYGRENFDNIPHSHKVWYTVEGADHYDLPRKASVHVNEVVIPWAIHQMENKRK